MNRRSFLKQTGLSTVIAASFSSSVLAQTTSEKSTTENFQFTTAPSVQYAGKNAITISIGVNGFSTAWLEFGETEALGKTSVATRDGLRPLDPLVHQFHLTGLQPGKKYFYRVGARPFDSRRPGVDLSTNIFTEKASFQTLNEFAPEMRFTVLNDTHEHAETLKKIWLLVQQTPADFLAWNGDVVNNILTSEEKIPGQYLSPGKSPFNRDQPAVFVRGNHDTRGVAARALPRFVALPEERFYFSFRQGPVAVLVLDSGEDKPDNHPEYRGLADFTPYHREQSKWLEAEFQKPEIRDAPFRIVLCHIPLEAKRWGLNEFTDDPRRDWAAILEKNNVAIAISGHIHVHSFSPATEKRSWAQLIGGGPRPEIATVIHGHATSKELRVTMKNLEGKTLSEFSARA